MRKLKSCGENQEIWSHNGKKYSLIDQWKLGHTEGMSPEDIERIEGLLSNGTAPGESERYEVADVTNKIVLPRGRYSSMEEARQRIKSGEVDNDRSFWSVD